jgi:adenylyltransferase/sulfurtransferase
MLNFLSHNNQKILVSGSATQMEGQLSIWKSGINKVYPCYECVFPKTSSVPPVTNCRESGIIGSITGLIGSMQVTEGIREIAFKKNSLILENSMAGYLFLYDGINQSLDKIKLTKNNECPICK